jgi:hypothetical protein
MTIAEWRRAYRERNGATIGAFVRAEFTKTGKINSFHARLIQESTEKVNSFGFEADVPLLGRSDYGACALAKGCGEFLLRRGISGLHELGRREFAGLTGDELDQAISELKPLNDWLAPNTSTCGYLSEVFRLRLLMSELEARKSESSHERIAAVARNSSYIAACKKRVEDEITVAREWHAKNEARTHYHFFIRHEFSTRSHDDQTVIAYRDANGWRP